MMGGWQREVPLCFYWECPMFQKQIVIGQSKWPLPKKQKKLGVAFNFYCFEANALVGP
jgi:hypothetical protein